MPLPRPCRGRRNRAAAIWCSTSTQVSWSQKALAAFSFGLHKDLSQGSSGVVRLPSNSRIEATASSSSIRHESSESRQQRSKVKPPRLGLCYLGSVYACNASALQGSLFLSIARTCPTENLLALL